MELHTIGLDDPRATDPTLVGAKAAGLARLRAAGFEVPDGIVIPTWSIGEVTAGCASEGVSGPSASERFDGLQVALAEATAALAQRLAVRSSATWEDSATAAHAGETSTELDVRGVENLLMAIMRCVDTSERARLAVGARGELAILVQDLVPAEWAGVAFTADPVTGERDVVRIAATEGLGEALVSGEVVGSDLTVRADEVEGDLAGMPRADVLAVAALARKVEALQGRPQDIEWAVTDGRVHLLQARPITVLPTPPEMPVGNNWQKDLAHYPEPMTPFGWSVIQESADEIRAVFDEMGLLVRGLEERFVGGEIYSRVLPAFGSPDDARKPPPAMVLGMAARVVPELRRRNATARRTIERSQTALWVKQWHDSDRDEMNRRADELAAVDLPGIDDTELTAHLETCRALTRRGIRIHFRLVMPYAAALYRLHRLIGEELGWDDARIAAMFAGHSPASREAAEKLSDLRTRIRSNAAAQAVLEEHPADLVGSLEPADPGLGELLRGWMADHGWAMVNYDAGAPVLAERPAMMAKLLLADPEPTDFERAEAVATEARGALPPESRAEFDRALAEAREVYPLREDNTIVVGDRPMALLRRWMLEVADRLVERGVIASIGDAAYLTIDELLGTLEDGSAGNTALGERRAGDCAIGAELVKRIARRQGEEAWVRAHPGPNYIGEQAPQPEISRLPAPLRTVNEPVLWIIGHEYPEPVDARHDPDVLVAGVAASAGVAEGPVRIITSHRDMDRLCDGDVLVCQVTSPSWAPVFPLAAAVVADGGGCLSHAAIAARENGLPGVLGCGNATSALSDGQVVRVDGTRGLVLTAD